MSIQLKIKIHTLADEGRHIKRETRKLKKGRRESVVKLDLSGESKARAQREHGALETEQSLHDHRTGIVRPAARICQLAYGFLRGVPYSVMEQRCLQPPDFGKIEKEAQRFSHGADWSGPDKLMQHAWDKWLREAEAHLDPQYKAKLQAEQEQKQAEREQAWQKQQERHRRRELAQLRSLADSHPKALAALASGDEAALETAGVPSAAETKRLARRTRPLRAGPPVRAFQVEG
jgi:hypothetical protein